MTLSKALERYLQSVSILKKGFPQERYRIEQIKRSFLGRKTVKKITSVDIATYRDQRLAQTNIRTGKPLAAATVRLELSLLSHFFDVARIEWGYCDSNPVANVRKPKVPPGRDRRLTAREERQILRYAHAHSNPDLYSIIVLALETAMRQGEILNLRWEHVNLKTRIAHLPDTKNGTQRDVPLSLKARDALIRIGTMPSGLVFGYTSHGLKSTWRFMIIKLGIENLHFHDLRHESVSRLFELGTLDMMEVAAISGHKSLAMLKRYTHLKAQRLVRKLEGNKNRGRQLLFDHLIPYPATVVHSPSGVKVNLLDFNLTAAGPCRGTAIQAAQDLLLRQIVQAIKTSATLPLPDQYLEDIDDRRIVMIDPIGTVFGESNVA